MACASPKETKRYVIITSDLLTPSPPPLPHSFFACVSSFIPYLQFFRPFISFSAAQPFLYLKKKKSKGKRREEKTKASPCGSFFFLSFYHLIPSQTNTNKSHKQCH
ncbi:hypothetical protein, unlikely [Trypanosoma brucei gambiense DAL972]|uniref:Uncharacterized protein n=1 Tax=Trypanosoma brucei gambiense (strain MHOM/CI/86/DAL972) TaxID=679716 RepID=C9ZXS1_TRYB9|nr:hypothetical protein, unlikely [Trypanosoma brucei gambiense DAL972]CBH14216.1 hypothetical protein, unlikely [Trypanosoma brucei gambiense DAL972]|eukprot:XP_011776486.1 hypothetical protein, unlikely [Trypanosoma brucei gambiense DAL972]